MHSNPPNRRAARSQVALAILVTLSLILSAVLDLPGQAFASDTVAIAQDEVDPARGCDRGDAAAAEADRGRCPDPCDDASAAHGGGGKKCDDPCSDGGMSAAHGGGGHHDKECPLPCPIPSPTPTATPPVAPTVTVEPPTATPPVAPTTTPEPPTATPPVAPTDFPTPIPPAAASVDHRGDEKDFDCETDDAHGRVVRLPVAAAADGVSVAHFDPSELLGEWVIADRTFTVTEDTILDADFGGFYVDKCVEVTWPVEAPTFALRIESEPDYKCGQDNASRIFGEITDLPDNLDLLGIWSVGGVTVTVVPTTTLDEHLGDFIVGAFVKVVFNEVEGERVASSVRVIWTPDHDAGGWWKWRMGRSFGPIESLPAGGTVGTWVIAGIPYAVGERTRLDDSKGDFAVGVNVKVEFFKLPDGSRIARKIVSTEDTGGGGNGQFRFVGVVDAKPTAFVGDWTIGGAAFRATGATVFNEQKGLLVVGAYVAVRYAIVSDTRVASEIKTVVPPGAGDVIVTGVIERRGDSTMAAASADGIAANVWRIAGQDFIVTEGTLLDDELSALEVGQLATVNAYQETDGTLVATSIQGITQEVKQFLPLLSSQ